MIAVWTQKDEHGDLIAKIIRQLEPRARVESCYCDLTNGGRFGKQLVLKLPKCLVVEAANIIHNVMMTIEMHPLCEVLSYGRSQDYTILQPIMESHIAAHQNGDCMELDIFSCRTFSEEIIMQLLPEER